MGEVFQRLTITGPGSMGKRKNIFFFLYFTKYSIVNRNTLSSPKRRPFF